MRCSSKAVACFVVVLILALQVLPRLGLAQGREDSPEKFIFDSVNRERAERGLSLLKWDEALARSAREHAQRMADRDSLSHQFPGEPDLSARIRQSGARFVALAENVAEGPSAPSLHAQWMNSPRHRENILDPQLNSLGIAVTERNAQLFAVEDFSRAVSDLSFEEQETQLGAQLQRQGLRLLSDVRDAQRICRTVRDGNLVRPPSYLMRYSTADLGILPDALLRELQGGHYHYAAIAACSPNQPGDYSGYQLAVLLYE